jgi:hypothetical protein
MLAPAAASSLDNLMQSLPKTFSAHHVPPRLADLAKVMELYQNDLNDAASIWSS